jgi:acetylornithine deacetylase
MRAQTTPVPASVGARIRLGFGRDRSPSEVQSAITAAVAAAVPSARVSFEGFRAPAYCDDLDHDLARTLGAAHTSEIGVPPARRVLAGTTDARSVGGPCICYGPFAGNLHGVDEWVDLASVQSVARVVANTLVAWQHPSPGR